MQFVSYVGWVLLLLSGIHLERSVGCGSKPSTPERPNRVAQQVHVTDVNPVMEGSPVNLICECTSRPPAQISWYKNGEVQRYKGVTTSKGDITKSVLNFTFKRSDHKAVYSCDATNAAYPSESAVAHITMNVYFLPRITMSRKLSNDPKKPIRIECLVEANPAPEYIRIFKGQTLLAEEFGLVRDEFYQCVAEFTLDESFSGLVTCMTSNGLAGPESKDIHVDGFPQKGPTIKPSLPPKLQIVNGTSDSLTFHLNFSEHSNTEYSIHYNVSGGPNNVRGAICVKYRPCTVKGLHREKNYTLWLHVEYEPGTTVDSEPIAASPGYFINIPEVKNASFNPENGTLTFQVAGSLDRNVVAIVEIMKSNKSHWELYGLLQVDSALNVHILNLLEEIPHEIRLKLCLKAFQNFCSEPAEAQFDLTESTTGKIDNLNESSMNSQLTEASSTVGTLTAIAIVLGILVVVIVVSAIVYLRRRQNTVPEEKSHSRTSI